MLSRGDHKRKETGELIRPASSMYKTGLNVTASVSLLDLNYLMPFNNQVNYSLKLITAIKQVVEGSERILCVITTFRAVKNVVYHNGCI